MSKKKQKEEELNIDESMSQDNLEEVTSEKQKPQDDLDEIVEDINEESEIEKLNKEIDKLKNDYARAYADTENLKKRLNVEAEQIRKYRIQDFAKEILPVLDNLERALNTEVSKEDEAFKKGVQMTYDQLLAALKKEGVEEMDCLDKEFDPSLHQAILTEKVEDKGSGIVIEILQKGYLLKDRILRPAMVKVSE